MDDTEQDKAQAVRVVARIVGALHGERIRELVSGGGEKVEVWDLMRDEIAAALAEARIGTNTGTLNEA